MTRDDKKQYEWRKKKTVFLSANLNSNTDADIIEYIEDKASQGETKQGIIKRCIRTTMQGEGYTQSSGGDVGKASPGSGA